MTTDGGSTFTEIILPMDQAAELPEHAEEYGHTLEDYAYLCMPVRMEMLLRSTFLQRRERMKASDSGPKTAA